MNPLERAAAASPWAHINVGEKLLLFIGLIFAVLLLPAAVGVPLVAAIVLALAARAKVPWRLYATLVAAPAVFIALGIIPLMVRLDTSGLHLVDNGVANALVLMTRSFVATAAMMVLALTTPIAELIAWFGRVGVPETLTYVVVVMYRMISTLIVTSRTMWEAQAMRLGHSSRRRWISSIASQAATLFVLSLERARRLGQGLELRADPTAMAVLAPTREVNPARLACIVCLLVALGAIGFVV
ncbi:cobalt ECF transporter T component CbiQ [Corynebacterium sp. SCR221107]|uniref:cobalt ECF transporter T component CbiQ n=1 Tax=Corynebacterium sp. SCR221107 TaxID=3017361 RepID=UPI0022EC6666|nr:cobalt ECF transporter T component CbiQ [Corynebacterium sp. SCR221107]WBT09496.1 cobalt ECF transporter T component CbiQ [Corynebacterium sp. SCR221107]